MLEKDNYAVKWITKKPPLLIGDENLLPSPDLKRTLEDFGYMAMVKERLKEIKSVCRSYGINLLPSPLIYREI